MKTKDFTITQEGKETLDTIFRMLSAATKFYRSRDPDKTISAVILGKKQYDLICPVLWDPQSGYSGYTGGYVDFPEELVGVRLVVVEEDCIRIIPKPKLVSMYGLPSLDS